MVAKTESWWVTDIIDEREKRGAREVRVHFRGERSKGNDRWLPEDSEELRAHQDYLDHFDRLDGHQADDEWEVERIVEQRRRGKRIEFKVCWYDPCQIGFGDMVSAAILC